MKIEANDKEIQDIFSLGYFKIPRFQRPYSWDFDEVESFWDDIVLEKSDNYFIGSMVVYQTKKPYFGIVDGQQRLTTITLILSAIRNAFVKIGEENLAKGVHKYVEKANIDNENEFVLNAETSFPFLQNHIQSYDGFNISCEVGSEEKKLETAFGIINKKLIDSIPELMEEEPKQTSLFVADGSAAQKLKDLRDKVLSLKLVFIQLDSEEDAYLIFETLNARGRDLTTSDLVKNLILKSIKNKNASIDQSKETWNSLVKVFDGHGDSSVIDSFLVHYWCSEQKYCTEKKLFSEIKSYISDESESARGLLEGLVDASKVYSALIQPDGYDWKKEELAIKSSLKALGIFKVKQQTAMTLALLRSYKNNYISLRNLIRALYKIEIFHYCFNAITSQRSSGSIASNYSKFAIELTKARSNDEIQKVLKSLYVFLNSKLPEEEEFVVKFSELEYSTRRSRDKAVVKYTLYRFLDDANGGLTIDFENLTLEHLLPESRLKIDGNAPVSSIGNLILLDQKTNSEEMADKDPKTKLELLKEKNYPLEKVHIDEDVDWDEEAIKNRTRIMAETIYRKLKRDISKN